MNVSKISALLNILEGITTTNELLDLPVEWRNGFVDTRNLIKEAKDSEKSEDGKAYTLIELGQAVERLISLQLFVHQTCDADVKVHVRTLVLAQGAALIVELHNVIDAITASRA
ncbi:hypothetical protein [Vibrio phage vB_ValS_PJ32]|nr:hypothetical protein [Vibrio phage vB_ValS_PJ32]